MSAVARERMMCGERVKVPVLVSANFCLCWSVLTFVCVGQCQLLFVLVSANVCLCWPVPTFVCVGQCQLLFVLVSASANFCLCWSVPNFVFTTRVFTRSQGLGFAL